MLLAIFLMALLVLSLAVAAPKIARSIQRDRDLETFHRGQQYRRAIQLYYRKFHAYPPNVNALINTNDIRFLRKKYTDPITGQDDWKPIAFGQNKTPTAMGFFGQPLSGNPSTVAGVGPSGGGNTPGGTGTGSGLYGGSSPGSGSIFGSSDTGSGQSPSAGGSGSTDNSGGTSTTGSSGTTGASPGGASPPTGSGTSSSSDSSGQSLGGVGIIGFSPASPKTSILIYKKKQHYIEWEFTYDPISDMQTVGGGNTGQIGQPVGSPTTPGSSTGLGGSPFGNSGSGNPGPGGPGSTSGPGTNPTPNPLPPDTSAPQ